jgi:hypothetical protein
MIDTIYESIVESIGDNEVVIYWMYWLDMDILIILIYFYLWRMGACMDIFDIDYIYICISVSISTISYVDYLIYIYKL